MIAVVNALDVEMAARSETGLELLRGHLKVDSADITWAAPDVVTEHGVTVQVAGEPAACVVGARGVGPRRQRTRQGDDSADAGRAAQQRTPR